MPMTTAHAPVALFVYNRLESTRRTVEALLANEGASRSDVFIYSDGARGERDAEAVAAVRGYVRTIRGFGKITIVERDRNFGLSNNIVDGVTAIVNERGRIIVLEDDLVTASNFLRYMNEALEKYRSSPAVFSITGYSFTDDAKGVGSTYFLPMTSSWGWATWADRWSRFRKDPGPVLEKLKDPAYRKRFDLNDSYAFSRLVSLSAGGKVDSWAVFWHATAVENGGLTLYPARRLVQNIGHDGSGTHCASGRVERAVEPFDYSLSEEIGEDRRSRLAVERSLRSRTRPRLPEIVVRVHRKLRGWRGRKRVLVTGARGFLGRNAALAFSSRGWSVTGVGHGAWARGEQERFGLSGWIEADVGIDSLRRCGEGFDVILHCAGGGSVGASFEDPPGDYRRTVESTEAVLEHMRASCPGARLIFPSTPAVHGDCGDAAIRESDARNPVSPYGAHKQRAEDLCLSHASQFGLDVSIIRFFSIYGPGLRKQLLWDACNKLDAGAGIAEFWGTGDETRDWLHVDDAVSLILKVADGDRVTVVNGGTGEGRTIRETLETLKRALNATAEIVFNGNRRSGDPVHYRADVSRALALGWRPQVPFADGISRYARWYRERG